MAPPDRAAVPDAQTLDPPPTPTEADALAAQAPTLCLNCGADLPGRFCPDCGQRDQPLRQPAHVFVAESVSEYLGVDGRLWRTLRRLLFRPGALTVAYLDGQRARYLRPLRIYLTATVLFFFLLSLQDPFEIQTRTLEIVPLPADSLQRVEDIDDALHDRIAAVEAEQEAIQTATRAQVPYRSDSLAARPQASQALADSLEAFHDRLNAMPDDSLIAIASIPARVQESLRDSSTVEVATPVNQIIGDGFLDELPEWAKGNLARRYQAAETSAERRLLSAQVQRAALRQIPTVLFLVLPLFAVLLKGLYLFGMGGQPRRRPRLLAPSSDGRWAQAWHSVGRVRWRWAQWRAHRRVRRRRTALVLARERKIRGAVRRGRRWVGGHPWLRRWRVSVIRRLRRELRMQRTPYYAEHLVFALHVHAFAFVMFVGLLAASALSLPGLVSTVLGAAIPLYFLVAQKRVYGQSWLKTLGKASALGVSYVIILALGVGLAGGLALRLG